jgi:hypothetical protein
VSHQLRQQMIHGDPNEHNTIIDEASQQVVGLIDWSDIVHCWLVAEVAMAVAYTLLMYAQDEQPLQAAGHVLVSELGSTPLHAVPWWAWPGASHILTPVGPSLIFRWRALHVPFCIALVLVLSRCLSGGRVTSAGGCSCPVESGLYCLARCTTGAGQTES